MSAFSEAYAAWQAVRDRINAMEATEASVEHGEAVWFAVLDARDEAIEAVIAAPALGKAELRSKLEVLRNVQTAAGSMWTNRRDVRLVEALQRDLERLAA